MNPDLSTGVYVNGFQGPSFPVMGLLFQGHSCFPVHSVIQVSFLKITISVAHLGLPTRNRFSQALVQGQRKETLVYLCMLYIYIWGSVHVIAKFEGDQLRNVMGFHLQLGQ